MSEEFSPYVRWLGLSPVVVRPNFYQLMGLPAGEQNPQRIQAAVEQTLQRVQNAPWGQDDAAHSKLIEELNRVRVVLQNPERKATYDQSIRHIISAAVTAQDYAAEPTPTYMTEDDHLHEEGPAAPRPLEIQNHSPPPAPWENAPGAEAASYYPPQPGAGDHPPVANYGGGYYGQQPYPQMPSGQYPQAPQQHYQQPHMTPEQAWYAQQQALAQQALPPAQPYPGVQNPQYPPQQPYGWPNQQAGNPQPPYGGQANYWQPPANQPPYYGQSPAQHGTPPPPPPPYSNVPQNFGMPSAPSHMPDPMAPVATGAGVPPADAAPASMADSVSQAANRLWGAVQERSAEVVNQVTSVALPQKLDTKNSTPRLSAADENEKRLEDLLIPFGLGIGALLILMVIGLSVWNRVSRTVANAIPKKPVETAPATTTPIEQPKPEIKPAEPTPEVPMPGTPQPGTSVVEEEPAMKEPEPPAEPEPKPAEPEPEMTEPATSTPFDPFKPDVPASTDPAMTKPDPMPTPDPLGTNTPEPTPEPKPEPMPEPKPPVKVVDKPTREEVQRLARTLTEARSVLYDQNTTEADELLQGVAKMKMLPQHREMFERLQQMSKLVKQCVVAIQMTIPKFEAGSTITIGNSTMISIVEGSKDHIVIRINGMNKRYQLNELPLGLAIALADMSLDSNEPVNLVVKGCYVLARAKDTTQEQKAREWFNDAKSRGVNVDSLLPLFDDDYTTMENDLR